METSAQGSPVLDLELKCGFEQEGPAGTRPVGMGLEGELAPETIEIILGEMVTPYTRSLDSALPGENIVFGMYSTTKNLWVSVHRDANGKEFVSWAASQITERSLETSPAAFLFASMAVVFAIKSKGWRCLTSAVVRQNWVIE